MAEKLGEGYIEIGAKTAGSIDKTLGGIKGRLDGLSRGAGLLGKAFLAVSLGAGGFELVSKAIARMAEKDKEFGAQIGETRGAIQGAFDTIASKFAPALQVAAEVVEGLAIKIAEWANETLDAQGIAGGLTLVVERLTQVVIKVVDAINFLIDAVRLIRDSFREAGEAAGEWAYGLVVGQEELRKVAGASTSASDATRAAFEKFRESSEKLFTDSGEDRAKAFVKQMRDLAKSTKSATDQTKELKKELAFMGIEEVFKKAALASLGAEGAQGVDFGKAMAGGGMGNAGNAALAKLDADAAAGLAKAAGEAAAAAVVAVAPVGASDLTKDAIYETAANTEKSAMEQKQAVRILNDINRNIRGFGPGF